MSDIYWTHACLTAIKSKNDNMFDYAMFKINNIERKNKLSYIKSMYELNDNQVVNTLNNFKSKIPVVIA